MDLNVIMQKVAQEIDGQFTNYDGSHSVIIVPLSGGRFQTVLGEMRKNELYNRSLLYFSSKICPVNNDYDYPKLLEQVSHFNYCRLIIKDGYLQIEAIAHLEYLANEPCIKEMLLEVANLADQYEMKLTGVDIQ